MMVSMVKIKACKKPMIKLEADPKIRDDERDQLIQDGKQDFTGKDVAKKTQGHGQWLCEALPKD